MNSVQLSALSTGCLYLLEDTLYSFLLGAESTPALYNYVPETNHLFNLLAPDFYI